MTEPPLTILLVDDEEALVGILADQLSEQFGYVTKTVGNGQKAIDLLRSGGPLPAVIISDYDMPEVNGLELLAWVKKENLEVPVILLTAAGSDTVATEALRLGAYDYLRKEQLDLQRLNVTIRSTLERRRLKAVEAVEREREKETSLNAEATDAVHAILTTVQPMIMDRIAMLHSGLDQLQSQTSKLPEGDRSSCDNLIQNLQMHVSKVDAALKALLELYAHVYSHHSDLERLQDLKKSISGL